MSIEFHDNSDKVKEMMKDALIAALHDAGSVIMSQTKKNSRVASGETKGAWKSVVDEDEMNVTIGNPKENAIYEEFGTGEYALEGKGRKGWWVYVKGQNSKRKSNKTYTKQEAIAIANGLRAKGLDAYATSGKKPMRMLFNAFNTKKKTVIRIFEKHLNDKFS